MKTIKVMKTTMKYALAAFVTGFFFVACEEEDLPTETISSEETADIVAASLAESTEGLTVQVVDATSTAGELVEDDPSGGRNSEVAVCGFDTTATFMRSNPTGSVFIYNYSLNYNYGLDCNDFNVPTALNFSFTQTGSLDAPRFASDDSRSGDLEISGLQLSTINYVVNGSYQRDGVQTSKVRNRNTYTIDLDAEINDLTVNKSNFQIEGGTATITINGSVSNGTTFSVDASVIFLGDGAAQIDIQGNTYVVDLENAEVELED